MKKGLLIYNEQAGQNDAGQDMKHLIQRFEDHNIEVDAVPSDSEGGAQSFCESIEDDIDIVFVLGGDGTVHECINGLAKLSSPPHIGILPGGTCNDFARALSIPLRVENAIPALMNGSYSLVDIPRVNERYFANFFGIGLVSDTSQNINETLKDNLGRFSYFWSALRTSFQPQSFTYHLQSKELELKGEAVMILVANGNHIGTIEMPQQPSLSDRKLDVYIVKEGGLSLLRAWMEAAEMVPEMDPNSNLQYYQLGELNLTTNPVETIDIDGEFGGQTPAHIHIEKRLSFLVPTTYHSS